MRVRSSIAAHHTRERTASNNTTHTSGYMSTCQLTVTKRKISAPWWRSSLVYSSTSDGRRQQCSCIGGASNTTCISHFAVHWSLVTDVVNPWVSSGYAFAVSLSAHTFGPTNDSIGLHTWHLPCRYLPEQYRILVRPRFLIAPHAFDSLNWTNVEEGEAVADTIKGFVPPDTRKKVPKPNRASPPIWKYGLKLKDTSRNKYGFASFGSPLCQDNNKRGSFIAICEKTAWNAQDHAKNKPKKGEYCPQAALKQNTAPFLKQHEFCCVFAKNHKLIFCFSFLSTLLFYLCRCMFRVYLYLQRFGFPLVGIFTHFRIIGAPHILFIEC